VSEGGSGTPGRDPADDAGVRRPRSSRLASPTSPARRARSDSTGRDVLLDHDRPAAADDHEATLLRHLMITHHGHGRPLVPTSAPAPMTTTIDAWGVSVRDACTDPGRADWLQPDRFRRLSEQYGYWGLALLEALLRQADHVASNASEVI